MNFFYAALCIATAEIGMLIAAPQAERTPWTKSYLETRCVASIDRYSMSLRGDRFHSMPRHALQGTFFASSAPSQDWEVDLGVQGRTLSTSKVFVRAERQLFSDLAHDPVAVTVFVDGSMSGHDRCSSPVYFEMAKNVVESGVGLGRHLIIRKNAYTQVFAYFLGGVGSRRACYASGEVGMQQVFFQRHYLRASFLHMKTFGSRHGSFHGIGTLKTDVNTIALSYAYRWYSGIEVRLTYIRRMLTRSGIRSSTTCQAGISVPISL